MHRLMNFLPLALFALRPCRDASSAHRLYVPDCAKLSPWAIRLTATTTAAVVMTCMIASCFYCVGIPEKVRLRELMLAIERGQVLIRARSYPNQGSRLRSFM